MKSFKAVGSCLLLSSTFTDARIPHSYRQLQERNNQEQSPSALRKWFNRFLKPRQDVPQQSVCYQDQYYDFVTNSSTGQELCEVLGVQYPDVTVVEEFTPIVTVTRVSTDVITENRLVRTTPVITANVTVTVGQNARRDAQVTPMARDVSYMRKSEYIKLFRRQADNSSELPPDNVIATSLNSACSCQGYVGSTVTQTYTNQPNFDDLFGFGRTTTTIYSTRVDREITSTVTVTEALEDIPTSVGVISNVLATEVSATIIDTRTEGTSWVQTTGVSQGIPSDEMPVATDDADQATVALSGTQVAPVPSGAIDTAPSLPDPTTPPFTCPDDDDTTVSQMLGSERFDYDVYCDADLPDAPEVPVDLSYDTLAECAASCSLSNRQFGQPVCQGVSYYQAAGTNCFLKSVANASDIVPAIGVNLAILRRIAVGIDEDNAEGNKTETIAFSEPTMNPVEVGSYLGSMFNSGNSASSVTIVPVAIVTGRPALDGVTAYSTYVSGGQTFSTGSVFSTYFSGNGSWWYSYFSTWSLAWTDQSTIYASAETAVPIITNDTSTVEEYDDVSGQYSVITTSNITQIFYEENQVVKNSTILIANETFAADGTEIYATTTTLYFSYTEAAAGGGGGLGGSDAGVITTTTLSQLSPQTVIFSSGFTAGGTGIQGSGNQVIQTPPPVLTSTSVFSTQTVLASSGAIDGSEGGQGGGNAGSNLPVVTSTAISAFSTEIIMSSQGGAAESGGAFGSGGAGDTLPAVTSTSISFFNTEIVISSPGNTAGGDGGFGGENAGSTLPVGTGSIPTMATGGTAFNTGGIISAGVSINGTSGLTSLQGSGAITTPALVTSASIDSTIILSTGGTGGIISTGASGSGNETASTSSRSFSFTNSPDPRSPGTESTTSRPLPATESGPSFSGPAPYPSASTVSSGIASSVNASIPVPTGTAPGFLTNSQTLRTGLQSESTSATGPVPYPPLSTSPNSEALPSNASFPVPTGTGSISFTNSQTLRTGFQATSSGTGSLPYQPLEITPSTGTPPSNVTSRIPTGTAPPANDTSLGASGSGSYSYTNSNRPRSGTTTISETSTVDVASRPPIVQTLPIPSYPPFTQQLPSGTGSSIALSTGGPIGSTSILPPFNRTSSAIPPFPTGTAPPSTCLNQTLATTTMWATTTVYGCYDVCPPKQEGVSYGGGGPRDGYRGPQSFGPPEALFAPTLVGNPDLPVTTPPADEPRED